METSHSYSADEYTSFSRVTFDAVVTGELTHQALYLEGILVDIICDHFSRGERRADFSRLFLRRDGLSFQDKIEIVRAMIALFPNQEAALRLRQTLTRVESYKALRNALAHGNDAGDDESTSLELIVCIVSRSGAEKNVVITPDTHAQTMNSIDRLRDELNHIRILLQV